MTKRLKKKKREPDPEFVKWLLAWEKNIRGEKQTDTQKHTEETK